eukprot:scaffold147663_cov35-Tisochrysis_lutea.AAC.1
MADKADAERQEHEEEDDVPPPPPPLPLEAEICIRYCSDGGELNEAFDVINFHDELGYRIPIEDLDEKFEFLSECSGDWSCHLIREDGNAKYEARIWMAKARAEACFDSPPFAPKRLSGSEVEVFSNLVPEAQYRFELVRGSKANAGNIADPFGLLTDSGLDASGNVVRTMKTLDIRNDDAPTGEDKASCSCIEGNPCASAYNCKDWANRFDVARRNGWKS